MTPKPRLSLMAVLLLAAVLRLWKIDSPIGGFHGFNEAHYSLIAKTFLTGGSLLNPTPDGRYLFLETPPLYAWTLAAIFCLAGVSVLAGRLVSVAASLGLVLMTWLLGRRLFSAPAGFAAALLVAVAPAAVLTGRNIQTDSQLLVFLAAAFLLWWRAESGGAGGRLAAGVLAGLALFTKLFAAVGLAALPVWETATKRGFGWLRDGRRWAAAGLALAAPALFYGAHALRDAVYVRRDVLGGAASATTFPSTAAEWSGLALEAVWAFSPLIALLLVVGALGAVLRPTWESLFVLLPLVFFAVFTLFVHKYSYYVLTLLPWGALLAGRAVAGLPRGLRGTLLFLAAASGAFISAVDLCSMKLGFSEFEALGRVAARLPGEEHRYLVDREMLGSYAPILRFYDPKARLVVAEDLPLGPDGLPRWPEGELYAVAFVPPQAKLPDAGWLFERQRYGLEVFGWAIAEAHANPHFFRQGTYVLTRTGGPLDFGLRQLRRYPALALAPVRRASSAPPSRP